MKIVTLIGNIAKNTEIKMSTNNLEIIEYEIDGIEVKSFGKVAQTAKSVSGLVVGTGTIVTRILTTKDGREYTKQEVVINKVEQPREQPKDNFDVKPEDFKDDTKIGSPKDIEIADEDLPW